MEVNTQPLQKDEYLKDGVIHCKNCNEPRQTTINIFGKDKIVRCICECQNQKYLKEEEEIKQKEKLRQIKELKVKSLLGSRYSDVNFENISSGNETFNKALERCKKYCNISNKALEEGWGIYIYGSSGTGKTHLTACMCNELTNQLKQCLFTNFFEISKSIRNTFNNNGESEVNLIERLSHVDFLFIDDIGTELLKKNGEDTWLQEKIYDIINKRYNNKLPTIFTSNYSLSELLNSRGMMDKTVDRILEMSTAIIKIEGKSYRQVSKVSVPF